MINGLWSITMRNRPARFAVVLQRSPTSMVMPCPLCRVVGGSYVSADRQFARQEEQNMALYKYSQYLTATSDGAFDTKHSPGATAPFAGIYRCVGCGYEIGIAQ